MSTWLDAFIDGELDRERHAQLEAHAAACDRCAASLRDRRALIASLATAPYFRAPAPLRDQLEQHARHHAGVRPAPPSPLWAKLSLAACVVLAGALVWVLVSRPTASAPSPQLALLHEAVSAHIRSLTPSHLTDVAASDHHTVKPWFAGKLDFSPAVADLSEQGFPLAGGRLDYLADHPVAALIYQRRAHIINLFTSPDPAPSPHAAAELSERGYHAVTWSAQGSRYCAVSDLSLGELREFTQLIQTHAAE